MARPRIVCFGPGPKFKGGIAQYNTALARALHDEGAEVHIVSWTQQYPAIIPREFVDKASRTSFLDGYEIPAHYITNWNRPGTWVKTANLITGLKPDKVIFQWYNPTQGIPLSRIAKRLRRSTEAELLFDLHFVAAKEQSSLDARLTRMALEHGDSFIVHAYKTAEELKDLLASRSFEISMDGVRTRTTNNEQRATILKLYHPIYSLYKPDPTFEKENWKREHGLRQHVFLFFGFIRKYKGLHHCIRAFAQLAKTRDDVSLLIVGESFWETLDKSKLSTKLKSAVFGALKRIFLKRSDDERDYRPLELIDQLGIRDRVMVVNRFVPNEEVAQYFQASDAVVLFYETATPSGVESLSYNFKLPAVATGVGHFPETIKDGFNGYLATPNDIADMARAMERMITDPIRPANVEEATHEMSWRNYAKAVLEG